MIIAIIIFGILVLLMLLAAIISPQDSYVRIVGLKSAAYFLSIFLFLVYIKYF